MEQPKLLRSLEMAGSESVAENSASPYTYVRTTDRAEAEFVKDRVPFLVIDEETPSLRSDEEIVSEIRSEKEGGAWYTQEYWRRKGKPVNQLEVQIGDNHVSVYNFNPEIPFTAEHEWQLAKTLSNLARHFPDNLDNLRYIIIDDNPTPSFLGDPGNYPANGNALLKEQAIQVTPRGMEFAPPSHYSSIQFRRDLGA